MAAPRTRRSPTPASSCSRTRATTRSPRTPSGSSPCCATSSRARRRTPTTRRRSAAGCAKGHRSGRRHDGARDGYTPAVDVNLSQELVPRLRGVLHAWALWFALVAACVLAVYAPTGLARASALVYGAGLTALFAASGLYHRWRWNPRWRPLLRRIDHSAIFVFIAASYTPVALLVLSGGLQVVVLASVWAGALAG